MASAPLPTQKVVVVDDDSQIHGVVTRVLEREGLAVVPFKRPAEALSALERVHADAALLLTDLHMPEIDGIELLRRVKALRPALPVVFMTGQATVESAVEAMKLGAYDYLLKPLQPPGMLAAAVRRALEYRRLIDRNRLLESRLSIAERFETMVGSSARMRELFSLVESVAEVDVTVLILGESGTGKELVARAIHDRSARSGKRFTAINCGALTESVLESELFGHVRGAFTGAVEARRGLFEEASGSTLLLDEIGELPASTQVKLLRVLQEGEIRPVGSNETRRVDVRVIAATHVDLAKATSEGRFRQDLFYRLNVVPIEVPPLRERSEDIPQLAQHFVAKHASRMGRAVEGLDQEALDLLCAYSWPGNVRELENAIARAIVLAKDGIIRPQLLPREIVGSTRSLAGDFGSFSNLSLSLARDAFEKAYLERVLERSGGNVAEAARLADTDPSNLRRVLKRLGIAPKAYR